MKKTFIPHVLSFLIIFALGVSLVGAQQPTSETPNRPTSQTPNNVPVSVTIPNPFNCGGAGGDCNLITFINVVVDKVVLPIGGIVAVLAFIWSGFMFVTAQGDEKKIGDARNALWYTAIGTAILLGARVLTAVLENTLKSVKAS
jgi:TrbC/VIRB2 family.